MKHALIFLLFALFVVPNSSQGETSYQTCIKETFANAAPERTVAEIRADCQQAEITDKGVGENNVDELSPNESAVEKRIAIESLAQELPFLLVPHKRNYLLPVSYNQSPNTEPFDANDSDIDRAETKFQFSFKTRIVKKLLLGEGDLWFGYTNLSFWQAYNTDNSSPFRETNHEPELFIDFQPEFQFAGWKNNLIRIGANHQSNGRGESFSRSWNRLYAMAVIEKDTWYLSLSPWYRVPESSGGSIYDSKDDNNPDIEKFLGYGEISVFYRGDTHLFGATFRNNLRNNNRYGLQLDWSFPATERLRGYVQYFNGYGESLIDYNDSTNRLGVGIIFSDLL
jgi:phospholipase A1